jgi:hypothetical protein
MASLHWIAVAISLILFAAGLIAFWRGLGLKPHPPEERPPERWGAGFKPYGFWNFSTNSSTGVGALKTRTSRVSSG